jgi:hypothetical protein
MSDERLRELERRARGGDAHATRQLARARVRAGLQASTPTKPPSKLRKVQRDLLSATESAIAADQVARVEELLPALIEHGLLDYERAITGTGPLLHHALEKGREAIARLLLEAGADVEARDYRERTPLMRARSDELLAFLLELDADVHARSAYQETPLHFAVGESTGALSLLLDRGADPNAQDSAGRTPLHFAAIGAYVESVRVLLARGADATVRTGGEPPLTPLEYLEGRLEDPDHWGGPFPPARRKAVESTLATLRALATRRAT